MKIVLGIILVILAVWVQTAWFGHVRPLGVIPNLMLVLVILFGLWSNASPTLAAAIGGGLLLDLASGSDFGLRMGFYGVLALAVVAVRQLGVSNGLLLGCALTITGTIVFNLVILATLRAGLSYVAEVRIGLEVIDNLVLMGLAFVLRANLSRNSRTNLELSGDLK